MNCQCKNPKHTPATPSDPRCSVPIKDGEYCEWCIAGCIKRGEG